jgi:O-antigen ligase
MIRDDVGSRQITQDRNWRSDLLSSALVLAGMVALVLGGVVISLLLGGRYSTLGVYTGIGIIGAIIMAVILLLRQDELAVTIVIAVQLYVDWYWGLHIVSVVMALVLLVIFFLTRSPQHPWTEPRALWLWALFLALAIFPAIRGATDAYEAALYYPNIFFGALILFWLGAVIARDITTVRRFFQMLAGLGAFLAVLTIVQAMTGTLWLGASHFDHFLAQVSGYQLSRDPNAHRIGAFFVDPNWNGTFFAMLLFIPLGLFVESSSFSKKVLYLVETFLVLPALVFTYSNGAWIAAIAGLLVFVTLVGRMSYRIQISLFVAIAAAVLLVGLSTQVTLQLQRASDPDELLLRSGAWQTAIRVIQAFPLTGVGLGFEIYRLRAEQYRVPAQYRPLAHPHNAYLELGAMAGLPVLITFVALVLFALWLALRNRALADASTRSLLGGGIAAVMALSVNSWSINGWTLPPLAAIGWLILGVLSSPLLRKSLVSGKTKESGETITNNTQ